MRSQRWPPRFAGGKQECPAKLCGTGRPPHKSNFYPIPLNYTASTTTIA